MRHNHIEDLDDINYNLQGNTNRIRANSAVLETLEGSMAHGDSLEYFYGNTLGNYPLVENTTAWENLSGLI